MSAFAGASVRSEDIAMRRTSRQLLDAIFRAGLAAVDPVAAVRAHVALDGDALRIGETNYDLGGAGDIIVIGMGKASARMASAIEEILGERVARGHVNVKTGHGVPLRRVRVREAGHPVPDESGEAGAREIVRLLNEAREGDLVICCISGGGSALMPLPAEGITLEDKRRVTSQLLASGATIDELNAVRKHLSGVKGGQLARYAAPAWIVSLILSDVVGDPIETIASGPTAPDPTTFAETREILERRGVWKDAPENVVDRIEAGIAGSVSETPKPGDPVFENVRNVLVATNRSAVEACRREAKRQSFRPVVLTTTLQGEASEAAKMLVAIGRECAASGRPAPPPACFICGGETTVTLSGDGVGGRNQEFALSAAIAMNGQASLTLLAAGTDGTDGPTDAAGAFADGGSLERARLLGLDARAFLAANDSYRFFEQLGDLLKTGPTGTNVMDLYLLLVTPSGQPGGLP